MPERVDLYDSTYGHFGERVLNAIRQETFGVDIGQNSWTTLEEWDRLIPWLELTPAHHVLEVASGSGGPALHLARTIGCRVTGIDANENGISTAVQMASRAGVDRAHFRVADANAALPFAAASFDGLLCIDSMNHMPNRAGMLREWHRVLRPGARALFTDPVVVTGPVTNDELALRSSIGLFLFVPPGVNERLITEAGLRLVRQEDVTANAALVAGGWRRARAAREAELVAIEGRPRFDGLQRFFDAVHLLTSSRRLSRIAYLAQKPV